MRIPGKVATILISLSLLSVCGSDSFAKPTDIGVITQADLAGICNKFGGVLLGVDDNGSYGCEIGDKNVLILCNRDSICTVFTSDITKKGLKSFTNELKLILKAKKK